MTKQLIKLSTGSAEHLFYDALAHAFDTNLMSLVMFNSLDKIGQEMLCPEVSLTIKKVLDPINIEERIRQQKLKDDEAAFRHMQAEREKKLRAFLPRSFFVDPIERTYKY